MHKNELVDYEENYDLSSKFKYYWDISFKM